MLSRQELRDDLKAFGVGCLAAALIAFGLARNLWRDRRKRRMGL